MRSNLTAAIAWRYLVSKKSHGAVGTISTVSVCAMAIATAAIICVLSVFNGFRREIGVRLDSMLADIEITPSSGKVFANADSLMERVLKIEGIETAAPTLTDNALVIYNGQEMPVTIKGILPDKYEKITSVRQIIPDGYGTYIANADTAPTQAVISIGVASRLQVYPENSMLIFAPKREGRVNMANPMNSFVTDSIYVTGVYRSQQSQYDDDRILLPISAARRLLQYDKQASSLEIKVKSGSDVNHVEQQVRAAIGPNFIVKDRLRQQEINFRMVNIEKWVSFLLLGFILVIASFNIISSLSMLVIEKENALSTFSAMGFTRKKIGRIFAWESLYVALSGGVSGILVGLILCFLQQHYGFIRIGGGDPTATILSAYPVEIQANDIWITLIPIITIAFITALITSAFAKSRISTK